MPRQSKNLQQPLPSQTLVVDNGAYTIKAGFAGQGTQSENCHVIPNCIARDRGKKVWVGSQLDQCTDFGEVVFRRPVEKGYLVNWEAEKAIWENTFFDHGSQLKPLFGAAAGSSTLQALPTECLLVIDSGYSHTVVTPLYQGRPIQQAIRRLEIGGKFLTNYLKELVSIRHYNMSDETHLINEVKEAVSFVSTDFKRDLERTWKGSTYKSNGEDDELRVDYVLPDYNARKEGFMRAHDPSLNAKMRKIGALTGSAGVVEDFMTLGNERFIVPELIFNPGDVGMKQAGLPAVVFQSLSGLPPGLWPAMLANILVVGGNSKIQGFVERLETEIRQLAPAECVVRLAGASDPIKSTWHGGAILGADSTALKKVQVTRQEYQEHGAGWTARVLAGAVRKP
ncbi:MAG: hypothetical protein Q9191_005340 [Dirinaria sp. TL-2023a]